MLVFVFSYFLLLLFIFCVSLPMIHHCLSLLYCPLFSSLVNNIIYYNIYSWQGNLSLCILQKEFCILYKIASIKFIPWISKFFGKKSTIISNQDILEVSIAISIIILWSGKKQDTIYTVVLRNASSAHCGLHVARGCSQCRIIA